VAAPVKAPTGRSGRPSKSLTLEQAQELLRAAGGSGLHAYVVRSVTTGLRTEELRALRWNDVDLDAGTVAVYRAVRATADAKTRRRTGHRWEATSAPPGTLQGRWLPAAAHRSSAEQSRRPHCPASAMLEMRVAVRFQDRRPCVTRRLPVGWAGY